LRPWRKPDPGPPGAAMAQVQEAAAMAQVQEVAQVQEAAVSQEVAQAEVQEAAKVVRVFIHSLLCAPRATSRASPSTKGRRPSK
jgi:hypothetical protein